MEQRTKHKTESQNKTVYLEGTKLTKSEILKIRKDRENVLKSQEIVNK